MGGVRVGLGVITIGVLAGGLAADGWSRLLPHLGVAAALLAAGLWWWTGRRRDCLLWGAVGLAAVALGAARPARSVRELPPAHVARLPLPHATTLVARVAAAPERRPGRSVLLVEAETVGRGRTRRPVSGRVRLTVRAPSRRWRYGERLRVDTTLRAPRNFDNPGSFDYAGHLARRGVYVTAFVWDGTTVERLRGRAGGPRAWLERWRARLAAGIEAAVPPPESAVLLALVVGEMGGVDAALREAFARAGVIHVLSISGLHVGLVAAGAFGVVRWLLARSEHLLLALDVGRVAAATSLLPVVLYAALAGLGVPTLRSALMIAATVLAGLLGRGTHVLRTLALSAVVVAVAWPGSPREIGFQLSFASVLAIVCGVGRFAPPPAPEAGRRQRWLFRLRAAALVSPCALLGTAPLTAFHFHQVSLIAVVANPLTVPIFGAGTVTLGLAGALVEPLWRDGSRALFRAAGLLLRPGIALVRALAAPGWSAVDVPIPNLLELLLLYAVLGGVLLRPRGGGRALLACGVLGLALDASWWAYQRFGARDLRVTFLDVGQGDASVVELPGGRVIVVDAGGFPGSDFDTGQAVVSPFLCARKILRLDALVMTHAHPDHAGGLAYLLAHHRPRELWWTGVPGTGPGWERLRGAIAASGARLRVLTDGVPVPAFARGTTVLHPPAAPDPARLSLNDSSLTLRLDSGGGSLLLTGDIESSAEGRLVQTPWRLPATVLKVPHHGSRTSSTVPFVAAVAPAVAVISVGTDNRYRLPAPEVEARYRAGGTCLLRTDRCGAITITLGGSRPRVEARGRGCGCPP
jgi:competence protein ComEC